MKKHCVLISILLLFFCYSCIQENIRNIYFERNNFKSTVKLVGEKINLKGPISVVNYSVVRDSFVFIQTSGKIDPYFIYIYNFYSKKIIASMARKGNGPGELVSCRLSYKNNEDHKIYADDVTGQKMYIYNIDSLINNMHNYIPEEIRFPVYALDGVDFNSDKMVCYNLFYLDDRKYGNNISPVFFLDKRSGMVDPLLQERCKNFTFNVSGGEVIKSPFFNDVWAFHWQTNRIDIFDNKLNLVKTMKGPGIYKPLYQKNSTGMIMCKNHKIFLSYISAFATKHAVYAAFVDINNVSEREFLPKPVEIFKFSWAGDLLCRYQLDQFVYYFTIDSKEKYLYASVQHKNFGESADLYRYKLQ